ncbi:YbaB/EbfC family nucleoid-associated protein [Nonomuraea sp. MG754425]|uniref:YbaB/EbfC family nucleoid-associated protein n=1 Tax=Nonomuraea sp. MG754425 TaxID=2570319 RepID=UPI001F20A2FD|nr:YbaB/EbfC family nucleoid-associated protein [Nonomuraea sp. MG754425]MCF6476137.1 YbaB/EbfC family nucleoid-associated protein [Nonomuraea sp. MG754425]
MQGFGDFANIDIDKLLKQADEQVKQMGEFEKKVDSFVGRAQDENGMVTVEYDHQGLRELELHPKAMRMSSGELAELIKAAIADATADFHQKFGEGMKETLGDDSDLAELANNPEAMRARLDRAEAMHDQAFSDVMGQLDKIRRRLEL